MFYKKSTKKNFEWVNLEVGMTVNDDIIGTLECEFINDKCALFTDTAGRPFVVGQECTSASTMYVDRTSDQNPWIMYTDGFKVQQWVSIESDIPVQVGDRFLDGRLEVVYQNIDELWVVDHKYEEMMTVRSGNPTAVQDTDGVTGHYLRDLSFK